MKDYVSTIAKSEEGIMNATQVLQGLNTDYSMWTAQERHDNAIREREMLKRETAREMAHQLEKGLQEGRQQGAHDARIETARAFLSMGVATPEQIAQATELSLAEVQSLKEEP